MKEDQEQIIELNDWISKLSRKQKRLIFKKDKFTDRVKLLMK